MKTIYSMSVAVVALMAASTGAHAQGAGPADNAVGTATATSGAQVGDIIVTASRRSETLQKTPIAVTAVNADKVQALGLGNITDIASITPGANFSVKSGFFSPHIRGIGTDYVSVGIESPVAVYEDGAYLTRTIAVSEILDNFDIGSIQVLRGPQGTLYGRNATGGVVLVNSADPIPDFEGRVRGEYGNIDHRKLEGMFNIPLGDELALRATAGYKHDDGYIRNIDTGRDAGGSRTYSVRAKLRWQPEGADIILGGEYYNNSNSIPAATALARNDATCLACTIDPAAVAPTHGYYETQGDTQTRPTRTEFYGATLRMTFDADAFDVSSVTTYRQSRTENSAGDSDLTSLRIQEFAVPESGGTSYTQDLQLTSKLQGPFNYLFGLSYLHDKGYFNPVFLGSAFGNDFNPETAPGFDNTATTNSYAAFLEGYYDLTSDLKITIGGRYTYERRTAEAYLNQAITGVPEGVSFGLKTSQRAFTPRFVLAWTNGPTNAYYSFTRGFKAGGFPGPITSPANPLEPEKIFSHEVGLKQSLFGNTVQLNLAAFYAKNKNQQTQSLDLDAGGTITSNAGAMENYGVEFEGQIVPFDGLNLGVSAAWQHARYKPYRNALLNCVDPVTGGLIACVLDITGTAPPETPEWSGSFNANYDFRLASWKASLSGIATYRSSINYQPGAGGPLRYDKDNGLFLLNASGYISPPDTDLRLGFFVNNITDRKYPVFRQTTQPYGLYYYAARPRTYGVRIEYRF